MKTTPKLVVVVLGNTVDVGCSCALYAHIVCTHTVVHHSADRVLSFMFQLSMANVGSISDDSWVPSITTYIVKNNYCNIDFPQNVAA